MVRSQFVDFRVDSSPVLLASAGLALLVSLIVPCVVVAKEEPVRLANTTWTLDGKEQLKFKKIGNLNEPRSLVMRFDALPPNSDPLALPEYAVFDIEGAELFGSNWAGEKSNVFILPDEDEVSVALLDRLNEELGSSSFTDGAEIVFDSIELTQVKGKGNKKRTSLKVIPKVKFRGAGTVDGEPASTTDIYMFKSAAAFLD